MRSRALLLAALVLLSGLPGRLSGAGVGWAQTQLVEKVARAEVPVYEDNLDDAKSRGIAQGKRRALGSLIRDLVAEEWVTLFDKELRRRILNRLNRYISSFRVQRLEPSVDRTRFLVILSVRINRSLLAQDLRELALPLRSDPPTVVSLLYFADDPILNDTRLRTAIQERLAARLALLNYNVTRTAAVDGRTAAVLADPRGSVKGRNRLLRRFGGTSILYVSFERGQVGGPQGERAPGTRVRALLYQRSSGMLLASFEHQAVGKAVRLPPRSVKARELLLARLVEPLILQIQPGAIKSVRAAADGSARLKLRVIGFASIEGQETFEQIFFKQNSPFERFSLYAVAPETVMYEGPYAGNRATLEEELHGKVFGEFTVRRVFWYNDVLELDVVRAVTPAHAEMRLFPPEVRPPDVLETLQRYFDRYSQLEVEDPLYAEVEDNGWLNRANPIPFNATVYAFLDARSDRDLFVGEALDSREKVAIIWHRVGRTHLSPAIRLYDENGVLVNTFYPRSWLKYEYRVPVEQHRFYLEVGDRFGFLNVDTGGYLNFHYLFKVQRAGP